MTDIEEIAETICDGGLWLVFGFLMFCTVVISPILLCLWALGKLFGRST